MFRRYTLRGGEGRRHICRGILERDSHVHVFRLRRQADRKAGRQRNGSRFRVHASYPSDLWPVKQDKGMTKPGITPQR